MEVLGGAAKFNLEHAELAEFGRHQVKRLDRKGDLLQVCGETYKFLGLGRLRNHSDRVVQGGQAKLEPEPP